MPWFRRDGDQIIVSVHAQPGAKRTGIQGLHGGALKIRVAAPPVDGAANDELRRFLAKSFDVALRDVEQIAGLASRAKRFVIRGSRVEPLSLYDVPDTSSG
ncbi:MAG: DUF167 domain-containing protein [Betaproteobacteria bacterium]